MDEKKSTLIDSLDNKLSDIMFVFAKVLSGKKTIHALLMNLVGDLAWIIAERSLLIKLLWFRYLIT